MYFDNLLALWIAIEHQLTPEDAFRRLERLDNNDRTGAYHSFTKEDLQMMKSFRKKGFTLKEIGEFYGVGASRICHILNH